MQFEFCFAGAGGIECFCCCLHGYVVTGQIEMSTSLDVFALHFFDFCLAHVATVSSDCR